MNKPKRTVITLAIGAKLTPKLEWLNDFYADVRKKIEGRTGIVTGHGYPYRSPIVVFPAVGRKKEYKFAGHQDAKTLAQYFDIEGEFVEMEVAR